MIENPYGKRPACQDKSKLYANNPNTKVYGCSQTWSRTGYPAAGRDSQLLIWQ